MTITVSAASICVIILLCSSASSASEKDKCDTCRKLVDKFHKGLEDTSVKNFGGGNTAWEEKTLSKYETSEIRLVEIIEGLCDSSDFECNVMVEEHEEQLEKWWFKMKKRPDLLKWFCVEAIEVCCPPGMYGPDCLACIGGSERPCHGNGFCSGDGSRGGDGSCNCKAAYTGTLCLECADGYYSSERNDSHAVCSDCHAACKTCHGPSTEDCKECQDGWVEEGGSCVDRDECAAETSPCKDDQYCVNTEGSFACKECDESCLRCSGEGPAHCIECAVGFALQDDACTDINECESSESVCTSDNEECLNTPGSYSCVCAEGYQEKDGECVEIVQTDEEAENTGNVTTSAVEESANVHEDL